VTCSRTGSSLTLIAKEIEEALVARIDLAAMFVTISREQDQGDAVEASPIAAQR
jgi:hypothetical protein